MTPDRLIKSRQARKRLQRGSIKLVCIDLDGTLIPDTTVSLHLAQRLGHEELLRDLERQYRLGRISNAQIADASAAAYRGLAVQEVERLLADLPLIAGARPAVQALKSRGLGVLLCTVTWSFAARFYACGLGLSGFCGTRMGERDGRLTGIVERHFDEHDKRGFVEDYCRRQGLRLSECAAVGDSRSDVPLFRAAGLAIALNATEEAKAAADIAVRAASFTEVLPLLLA